MTKTKHLLSALGAACMAFGSMANALSAATFENFEYEDGETITITGYIQDTFGPVVIPATIDGKTVSTIGTFAFKGLGMSNVSIPGGVTRIDSYAFYECTNLTKVTLPPGIATIGNGAFRECSSLTGAFFGGTAPTLGSSAFAGAAKDFKVYFVAGSTGFTVPKWKGYPSAAMSLKPEIAVQQPAGNGMRDGAAKRTFGTAKIGIPGLADLKINKTGAAARDFIVSGPKLTYLALGSTTTFTVTFKPRAKGTRNAAIHIRSNDSNENPFDIKLSGMGVKK